MKTRWGMFRAVSLLLVATVSLSAGKYPLDRSQTGVLRFPQLGGDVRIEARIVSHALPEAIFTAVQSSRVLLRTTLGSGDLNPKYIDLGSGADPFPIIRFKAVSLSGMQAPLVFLAAMDAGASDCSYWGSVVGEVGGELRVISPTLPLVNAEGGYALMQSSEGKPELVAWNFIWAKNEAHVDPHAYWVKVYRFDSLTGSFVLKRNYVVPKGGPEITFPNLLAQIPDFTC